MIPARDHAQRRELNDEVHARPPEQLSGPSRLTYVATICTPAEREQAWQAVCTLASSLGGLPPPAGASHYSASLGAFRLKWEAHTEFLRYTFIVEGEVDNPFADPAIAAVPADWVAGLPGEVIVATHAALVKDDEEWVDVRAIANRLFHGNVLIGSAIAGGAGVALTDLRIHTDRFGRLLVLDRAMNPFQAGRMVQHLLEVETYRMLALLALPVARRLAPVLADRERELAKVAGALVSADEADEPVLLERLTRLQAELESRQAESLYRFSAANAYYELVQRRIVELRENRLQGLQTFQEFTERRMAPAMNTCRSVAERQDSLAQHVAQATQLLSTRVNVTRERQNQVILASMDRRAQLQLRLQSTVEGLSIAAITYYLAGLIGYLAKGAQAGGVAINAELVTGASIPLVAALAGLGLWSVRRMVHRKAE